MDLTKAVASQNESLLLQQPGGMFMVDGIDRMVISAQVRMSGLAPYLSAFPNNTDDPRYGYFIGFGDQTGTDPDYICNDAPYVGMSVGNLSTLYGLVQTGTPTIEATSLAKKARSSTSDLALVGYMANPASAIVPPNTRNAGNILNSVIAAEMVGAGVLMERKLTRMVWTGNPANNTTNGGYKEFNGLDRLIKTGHTDVDAGTAIPALDSMIWDFDDYVQENDSPTKVIADEISRMAFMLGELAEASGLAPVTWAICMSRDLFYELTAIWACNYLTSGCGTLPTNLQINGDATVNLRWSMYNEKYLLVNGQRFTVIVDDGIAKTAGTGSPPATHFESAIYFVPLTFRGNLPATHWEFVDYTSVMRDMSAMGIPSGVPSFWTDGGRFMWAYEGVYTCFKLKVMVEPRIILRVPQLAGKIQGVWYQSTAGGRSPFPDEAAYVGGGVSTRS